MSNDHAFGPRITSGSGRTSRQAGLLMLALSRFVWTHGLDDDLGRRRYGNVRLAGPPVVPPSNMTVRKSSVPVTGLAVV